MAQTRLQRDLVAQMQELVAFLKQAEPGSVGIEAGEIRAENVVSGQQILYRWEEGTVRVAGDVHGDVFTGNKETQVDQRGAHIGRQVNVWGDYYEQSGTELDTSLDVLLGDYLRDLAHKANSLPWATITVEHGNPQQRQGPVANEAEPVHISFRSSCNEYDRYNIHKRPDKGLIQRSLKDQCRFK